MRSTDFSFCVILLLFVCFAKAFPRAPCHRFECWRLGLSYVCGSDGRTYLNFCELERMRCFGLQIRIQAKGRCKDTHYGESQREQRLKLFEKKVAEEEIAKSRFSTNQTDCSKAAWRRFLTSIVKTWISTFYTNSKLESVSYQLVTRVIDHNFDRIDTNYDNRVSAYEWKVASFRFQSSSSVGQCARELLRRCDRDGDRAFNRIEWLNCWDKKSNVSLIKEADSAAKNYHKLPTSNPPVDYKTTFFSRRPCGFATSKNYSLFDRSVYLVDCNRMKPMSKCSKKKNLRFLQMLFSRFRLEMWMNGRVPSGGMKSARRQLLEPTEWRKYRTFIRSWLGVKKCGRLFFQNCDFDLDRRINSTEWHHCTVDAYEQHTKVPRVDRNPLVYLLRPDDKRNS
ncbi:hypothetical protein M3Y96_00590400 [Aphelenchoides besseyi]|nr:hypothetical protein M3Y96_00590400 [Aphelenchoides besseyi]